MILHGILNHSHKKRLAGNHEDYFINGSCFSNNHLAKEFFSVCFEGFNKTSLIKDYSDHHILGDFTCIHTIEGEYIFEDTWLVSLSVLRRRS